MQNNTVPLKDDGWFTANTSKARQSLHICQTIAQCRREGGGEGAPAGLARDQPLLRDSMHGAPRSLIFKGTALVVYSGAATLVNLTIARNPGRGGAR